MTNRLSTLGLAYRAGKLVFAKEVYKQIKRVKLVVIASDMSQLGKQRISKKLEFYNLPYIDCFDCRTLSGSLGKNEVKLIGVIDEGFARAILK